jgi:hypothetical protein
MNVIKPEYNTHPHRRNLAVSNCNSDTAILIKIISKSIRLQLFSKCSFNPMSVIGYDVG